MLELILLGLAAALSSVPISATIFILLSEQRKRSGLAFLAGTVLGTFAAVSLATVTSQALPGRPREHDLLAGKLLMLIGLAMIVLGVVNLARRNSGTSGEPGRLESIASLGVLPVFGIGLALNFRPKAMLLVGAAGLTISRANLQFNENVALVLVYTTIATCTVVGPIVATIVFPRGMEPRLLSAKQRIVTHSSAVGGVMMIVIGSFIVGIGMTG